MLQLESYLNQQIEQACRQLQFPNISYQIDRPRQEAHGDISINLAMLLTKALKQNPRQIAARILEALSLDSDIIEKVEIAGPGFINFFIAPAYLQKTVGNSGTGWLDSAAWS